MNKTSSKSVHTVRKNVILSSIILLCGVVVLAIIYSILTFKKSKDSSRSESTMQYTQNTIPRNIEDMWGMPAKTMFPDIVRPKYVDRSSASFLSDADEVLMFKYGGKTYVYPISVMTYHHIVNDIISGEPLAITYCLLSNTAVVFSRKVDDRVLDLGVLGPLYFGNEVMYDRQTDTYWHQLTGESFYGSLLGKKLTPAGYMEQTTWKKAKELSDLEILTPIQDIEFYTERYATYKTSSIGINSLPKSHTPDQRLPEFENGLGIIVGNQQLFIPVNRIKEQSVINMNIGDWSILALYDTQKNSYKIFRRFTQDKVLTYKSQNDLIFDTETNSQWNFDGLATFGPMKGTLLEVPFYAQAYWYSWSAFYPTTNIQ